MSIDNQAQIDQMQALTRDWNQKSRIDQIIIRHQIWNTSDLPNSEYTASWPDVKLLVDEREELQEVNKQLVEALRGVPEPTDEGFCSTCGGCDQLPLIKTFVTKPDGSTYDKYYWQHEPECWYGKVFAALNAAKPSVSESGEE